MAQRHFHQHDRDFALEILVPKKLFEGPIEYIERRLGDGPEPAALDQNRFFVKDFGPLRCFALGGEHCGFCEPLLHEPQGHEPVVHAGEGRASKADRVHFDALPG